MEIIFSEFPREFGTKRTYTHTKEDFIRLVNKFNGIKDCYSTIYPVVERRCYDGNGIDKIFFDLDNQKTCWESTKQIHFKLFEMGLKHTILLSGGGFHIYVFVKKTTLKHPKNAIKQAQQYIARECNVTIGKPKHSDIDEHIIGDIARIARVPNTWNIKRRRYCIYIIDEDMDKTFDEIKIISKQQRFKKQVYCEDLLDISIYDTEAANEVSEMKTYDNNIDIENVDGMIKLLPPFVRKLLLNKMCGWFDRYIQILTVRETGIPESTANKIFKEHWDFIKYKHSVVDEGQIRYIYNRPNLVMPTWETLISKGYEITDEDRKYEFYKE